MDAGSTVCGVAFDPPSEGCRPDKVVGGVVSNHGDATANSKRSSTHDEVVEGLKQGCGRGLSVASVADLSETELYAWAERMFAGGSEASVVLGGEPAYDTPTVGLCLRSKAAVADVYRNRASDICRSPERPDLRLSKEEAQGHFMGSLVIGELLESEARCVGKDIDNVCAKEQVAKKRAATEAKEARRKARQAAADSEAAAEAAAAVDVVVENALADRLRASVVLPNLPSRKSVIVPARAPRRPKVSRIIRTPEDHLERLVEHAAVMQATVPLMEAAWAKATRARERAQDEGEQALKRVRRACASASDDTFAALQSEYVQSRAKVVQLMCAEQQAEEAVYHARWAALEATDDVRMQQAEVVHERARQFRDAAEAERRGIATATDAFFRAWEASGHRDRVAYQLGMILSHEPTIEELGWTQMHVYDREFGVKGEV